MTIDFAGGSSTGMVASIIGELRTPCPEPESIALSGLLRLNALAWSKWFLVDSPLREEAREVVYQLPKLNKVLSIIQEPRSLLPVTLRNDVD